jgi:phosphopantetheinyl transferase
MKYTTSGKPYFDNHLHFSFTYNEGIVIVAIAESYKIGIDMETIRPISWQSYENYFAAEDWLKIKRSKIPTLDLIEAWVTKEAANKLEGIKALPLEHNKIKIRQKRLYLNGKKYYHEKIVMPAPFIVKIVSQQRLKSIQIENVTRELSTESALYILRA